MLGKWLLTCHRWKSVDVLCGTINVCFKFQDNSLVITSLCYVFLLSKKTKSDSHLYLQRMEICGTLFKEYFISPSSTLICYAIFLLLILHHMILKMVYQYPQ
jgi:hypothetical protein